MRRGGGLLLQDRFAVRCTVFGAGAALIAVHAIGGAVAQEYPARPVRFVVASGPGGSTDTLARLVGERLSQGWKHPLVYDNRPGAGGILAGEATAKAQPDGHTLLFSTSAAIAVSVSLYQKLPYDPIKDFAPIVQIASQPYMLISHPASVSSVKELIAAAKANPGQISFSHTGAGTGTHLAGELFMRAAQVKLLSVPYKSIGQSMTAVLSGETQLTFTSVYTAWNQAKNGRVKALAVTGKTRSPAAPPVPTMAEAGLPNYVSGNWYGLLAPAGTPRSLVEMLNTRVNAALTRTETKELLITQGFEPAGGTPDEFARFIASEIREYAALIKSAGLKAQ